MVTGWWLWVRRAAKRTSAQARRQAAKVLEEAEREKNAKLREAELAAKEKLLAARNEFEKASRKRRDEIEALERRLTQKEDNLEKRFEEQSQREREVGAREKSAADRERKLEAREAELTGLIESERAKLERIAGLTAQQAKEELVRSLTDEARMEAAHLVKRIEDEAREQASREAQRIVGMAVQRSASDYVAETTVSVVVLPNDEMKGRIIGREGRNIRALEALTGVDLIVDDTPEAVILSGFDPLRREIARTSLERLIADGRIHPARIEEVVEQGARPSSTTRSDRRARRRCSSSTSPTRTRRSSRLLGRLRYRTSYGQNVLQHSKEVAFLAGTMAAELKVDVAVAKRAGLFHDIGKAVDREMEGGHLHIGVDLLRKVRRERRGRSRHGLSPRRLRSRERRGGVGDGLRRPVGRPPGSAPRDPRDLRQAAREAGRVGRWLQRGAEDLCHPGRP